MSSNVSMFSDRASDKYYMRAEGFTSTLTDSFQVDTPRDNPSDLAWTGTDMLGDDSGTDKHYRHTGFTTTLNDSYDNATFAAASGITWDGTNVVSGARDSNKHFLHSGFSSTISDSYGVAANNQGMSWDVINTDLYNTDLNADKHYHRLSFTSTINNSYASNDNSPTGIVWVPGDDDIWSMARQDNQQLQHSGFSSTISDSFTMPGFTPSGLEWNEVQGGPFLLDCDPGPFTVTGVAAVNDIGMPVSPGSFSLSGVLVQLDIGVDALPATISMAGTAADIVADYLVDADSGGFVLTGIAAALVFLLIEQEGYRWRNDDGSESAASWRQDQDVDDSVNKAVAIRVRVLLDTSGDQPGHSFQIEYKETGDSDVEYRKVEVAP